jgi:hypothetical protein
MMEGQEKGEEEGHLGATWPMQKVGRKALTPGVSGIILNYFRDAIIK